MNPQRVLPRLLRLFAAGLLLQSAGCAPKIYTSLQKSLPPRPEGSAVLVYNLSDSLPATAEVLGTVEVRDNGFSTNCGYPQVLQRAKEETNKAGGNGLILTWHKEPTVFGSSCHQIAGDILLIPDSAFTASWSANAAMQTYRSNYFSVPAATPLATGPKPADDRMPCTILVNAGYGFIVSKMELFEGVTGNPKQGFNLNAAFQWAARSGLGFGLRYGGYYSSANYENVKFNVRLHYIAPEFVMRQEIGRRGKWIFRESVGIGYARYSESVENISVSYSGVGFHIDLGVEYKLSPHVGIGAGIGAYGANFGTVEYPSSEYAPEENSGISYLAFNGGLRFYF